MFSDMETPAHEFAPAHLYESEAAAYYRSWRLAVAVSRGLSVACAHADRPMYRPGRAEHEAHAQDVAEFARLARKCLEANPAWEPSGMFMRWLWGRGVQVAEVFELVSEPARKVA